MKRIYLLGLIVLLATLGFWAFCARLLHNGVPEERKARMAKAGTFHFLQLGDKVAVATLRSAFGLTMSIAAKKIYLLVTSKGANAISYSSDGGTLAVAHWDRHSAIMECRSLPNRTVLFHTPRTNLCFAISIYGRMIAVEEQ